MPFFQNPFPKDFEGNWLLGDRHHIPKFIVPGHTGRGTEAVYTPVGTYNLSGNDADGNAKNVLRLTFAVHDFKIWNTLSYTISASNLATTTAQEVMGSLNNNEAFSSHFTCRISSDMLIIAQNHKTMLFYVNNGRAEETLRFNLKAGVAEIPSYFARHTMANRNNFVDSANMLLLLDPSNLSVDAAVINNAVNVQGKSLGYNASNVQEDYELLKGRSGLFIFTKHVYDGSNLSEKIEYHAGAQVGDLAKKTIYTYDESDLVEIFEIPYVLESDDMISP